MKNVDAMQATREYSNSGYENRVVFTQTKSRVEYSNPAGY